MTQALYEQMWAHQAYRKVAPGEHLAYRFVEVAKPDSRVIDFGAGTGRGAVLIHALANVPVTALDWAANCLDPDVATLVEFAQHDLREPVPFTAEYGYCTDVLEHVAPEDVDIVLRNILTASRKVFFQISTVPDHFGPVLAGEPLHLTVRSPEWWICKLADDFGCRILWASDTDSTVVLYVTAYANARDIADKSVHNASDERLRENIRANLALGLQELAPHEVQNDTPVYLLAGGPSLTDFEDEIVELGRSGALFVTVNGTYEWLLERGIKPAAHVMIDAREFNKRFVKTPVDTCRYLVSSQCAHEAVAVLPKERTWLWHSGESEMLKELFHEQFAGQTKEWFPVYGGSTVVTRGLVLLAMLGFRKVEIFGWDSCLRGDEHHAYAQPENDSKVVFEIKVGQRIFRCHSWMAVQAQEVPDVIKHILSQVPDFEMSVRGDGLIAAVLEHAASSGKEQ